MLRIAVTLAALALGGIVLDDAEAGKKKGGKRGKVVRVERSRFGTAGSLRVCQLNGNNAAICYGSAPVVGDTGPVIDANAMYGEARVLSVTPTPDSCNNITSWAITFDSTNAAVSQLSYGAVFVIDLKATTQARSLPTYGQQTPVSSRQGEVQYVTLDSDGDLDADVYITAYTCDAAANFVAWGQGQVGYCMGYYVDGAKGWTLQRTDVVRSC